jgi:6-phosphofructo-2-kinase/fructose-2,6-biphosphatase 4
MRWLGVTTKVFSVGNYRRERLGSLSEDWFDPSKRDGNDDRFETFD